MSFPRAALAAFAIISRAGFPPTSHAALPAFPGAEGFGAYAVGGRLGDVYHVTNTNASGAGSLANGFANVPAAGRTIVFDVSGYSRISGTLRLTAPKVTIAGQTAPGDGFGLYNGTFLVSSDDAVIRFMRFRNGNSADSINMDSGSHNSIWDHVDAMFSNDENFSTFNSSPDYMTFQWSFNAWGMETHSCGGLWDMTRTTAHHTLWAHNHTRNPKVRAGMLEWINNVTFDWDIGFIMGDSQTNANWTANAIGCYFIGPPGNTRSKAFTSPTVGTNGRPNFTLYLADSLTDIDGDGVLNGIDRGYGIVEGTSYATGQLPAPVSGDARYYAPGSPLPGSAFGVVIDSPLVAYKKIVSSAGPVRFDYDPVKPLRDEVAELLITNLVMQRPFHVNAPSKTGLPNGGFGNLVSTSAPVDTDQDGIPDYFEAAVTSGTGSSVWNSALDDHTLAVPNSGGFVSEPSFFPANTAVGTAAADKYTHLEEYLHFLAIPHGVVAKNTAAAPSFMDIDLSKFTRGFNNGAVFTLTNVVNGAATQSGTGGKLVRFVPTLNAVGRAKFNFTVTDADGSTWTQPFAILVSTNSLPRDLTWKGDGVTNVWNSTAVNWLKAGEATAFASPDYVTFDDTGSSTPSIALTETVSPSAININASADYSFTTANGSLINGSTALRKFGTGTLTIATPNVYSGGTVVDGSTLVLANGGGIGSGALTLQNGATFTNGYPVGTSAGIGALFVPAGSSATFNSGNRLAVNGALTGGGALTYNVQSTVSRFDLRGYSGGFTGPVSFTGSGTVRIFLSSGFGGFDAAAVDVGPNVSWSPQTGSGGNGFAIGALSGGGPASVLGGASSTGALNYSIGALNLSTTFAGSIQGNATFAKVGTGTLTLSGASTYTGATSVTGGTLVVNGSLGTTAVNVASGTTLAGAGSFGGVVTVASGGKLAPGSPGAAGTISPNALTIGTGSTILFDLSSAPASGNDKIALGGGKLTSTGSPSLQFNLVDGLLGAGTYPIITGGSNTSNPPAFATNLPTGARQSFVLQTPAAGTMNLVVTGVAATLKWQGSTPSWNTNNTVNWTGAPDGNNKFLSFDAVTFDDTGATGDVAITGAVRPRSLTVNNSARAYTFTGGTIAGTGSLIKNGPGTLTIAPVALVLNSTTTVGTTVTVDTTSLAAGMNVTGAGISAGTTIASITNATTLVLSQAATAAATVSLSYFGNSYSGGTVINDGGIVLANELSNGYGLGTGPVTFNGGTLSMYVDSSTYSGFSNNFIVPVGATGTINTDSRVDVSSSLSGGGTLNYFIPASRTALFGNWSAFTGVVNVTTDADGGDFRFGTNYGYPGFPNAGINLATKVSMYYIGTVADSGTTITIGEISGAAGSWLMGGATNGRPLTYRVGGRNTDATFAGNIVEQGTNNTSYVKIGAGTWTLSGPCVYNGGTTVEQGTLRILGALTSNGGQCEVAGFATLKLEGGGSITVDSVHIAANGQFSGFGTVTGDLTNDGSTSTTTGGKLTITGTLTNAGTMTFTNGSSLEILGDMANSGTLVLLSGSQLIGPGAIVNDGIVDIMTGLPSLPANFVNNGIVLDSSQVAVQSYALGSGTFTVCVRGFQGHSYQLQRTSSLGPASWQSVGATQAGAGALSGPGSPLHLTDPGATGARNFYRVVVSP